MNINLFIIVSAIYTVTEKGILIEASDDASPSTARKPSPEEQAAVINQFKDYLPMLLKLWEIYGTHKEVMKSALGCVQLAAIYPFLSTWRLMLLAIGYGLDAEAIKYFVDVYNQQKEADQMRADDSDAEEANQSDTAKADNAEETSQSDAAKADNVGEANQSDAANADDTKETNKPEVAKEDGTSKEVIPDEIYQKMANFNNLAKTVSGSSDETDISEVVDSTDSILSNVFLKFISGANRVSRMTLYGLGESLRSCLKMFVEIKNNKKFQQDFVDGIKMIATSEKLRHISKSAAFVIRDKVNAFISDLSTNPSEEREPAAQDQAKIQTLEMTLAEKGKASASASVRGPRTTRTRSSQGTRTRAPQNTRTRSLQTIRASSSEPSFVSSFFGLFAAKKEEDDPFKQCTKIEDEGIQT